MASGRGEKKKRKSSLCCFVFSLKCDLKEIVSVNCQNGLTTAKLQCWERGTASFQECWGREVAPMLLHATWCWQKGWQRGSVAWTCWDSHWREVDTSTGAGKPHPELLTLCHDGWSQQETRYLTWTLASPTSQLNYLKNELDYLIPSIWKIDVYTHTHTPKLFKKGSLCFWLILTHDGMNQKYRPSTHCSRAELKLMQMSMKNEKCSFPRKMRA